MLNYTDVISIPYLANHRNVETPGLGNGSKIITAALDQFYLIAYPALR